MACKFFNIMTTNILSKDIILQHTTSEKILLKFLNLSEFPKGNILSPLKKEKNPSFTLNKDGSFKCWATGLKGDAFELVAQLNGLDCKKQFLEVLKIIATEMNILQHLNNGLATNIAKGKKGVNTSETSVLTDSSQGLKEPLQHSNNDIATKVAAEKTPAKLSVTIREFTELDLAYWKDLGVEKTVLQKYKVYSISESYFDIEKSFKTKENTVSFAYQIDGLFKKYTPEQLNHSVKKSIIPHLNNTIFGFEQLNSEKKENILICEGEKDTIVASSRGFNSVSFGSATTYPTKEQIEKLQSHCNNLLICYDADDTGLAGINEVVKRFPKIIPVLLPKNENIKNYDITDYFQDHTADDFQKIIDLAVKNKSVVELKKYLEYQFPDEIKEPIEKYIKDIENYQMFMANNQIWIMKKNKEAKHSFYCVSNFAISILQHLQDEKYPIKLIRLKNTQNSERVFDIPADAINTLTKLDNVLSNQGNYRFYGNLADFNLIKRYLLEKMGTGKKIEVLGWQDKGNFWAWNNKINLCDGKSLKIDKYGCFAYQNKSYYIPSANTFNEDNEYHYEAQKKFIYIRSSNNIKDFISKVIEVHGQVGISAILFTISSLFSDIIFKKAEGIPMLFLYGRMSSGKTQLAYCCQAFLGIAQPPLNLENGVSTKVAQIRELAQFKNGISHLAEYKPGNKDLDGTIKGIFDRNGYKRGVKESSRGTDVVPIESTAIITGNFYPNDEALISRLIWLEMQTNERSDNDKKNFNDLKKLIENGVSSFSDDLLSKRSFYETDFYKNYNAGKLKLPNIIGTNISRLTDNLSMLYSTFKIFENDNIFPFTENEMIEHFKTSTEYQMSKLKSADMLTKWWDCFLICFKSFNDNRLGANEDFKLDGNTLSFTIGNVYSKIQRQWFLQYKENIPSSSTISEAVKKDKCFIKNGNVRIRVGGLAVYSFIININETNMAGEFLEFYNYQVSNIA